jgi:hypothetical protein
MTAYLQQNPSLTFILLVYFVRIWFKALTLYAGD